MSSFDEIRSELLKKYNVSVTGETGSSQQQSGTGSQGMSAQSDGSDFYTIRKNLLDIIKLCDNTVLEFSASSPFYIIDQEKGFRGDRLLCHQLADLYSQLDACYFPRVAGK